jgi:precorrin-2 C20-methyltransferase/precorrin-3B C17-methyltransferase
VRGGDQRLGAEIGDFVTGHLYGVGVGPGDPELITLKAARLISNADVIAYHSGTAGRSIARTIAGSLIAEDVIEELLIYPVTTGPTDHPLGYYGAVDDFYDESAERLTKHLDAGRTVVVLAEGDPLFYSSYMYLHDRLSPRFPSEIVPGVTSLTAAATALKTPLARHEDVLVVLPGTLPVPELARRLADTDAAAIMKLGRTFAAVREALRQSGRLGNALYVERATTGEQRVLSVAEVDPAAVPYFSMIVVPGRDRRVARSDRFPGQQEHLFTDDLDGPRLFVVGLGPGSDGWTTPEVSQLLTQVDHVVGYGPYLDRLGTRPGLQRHASGNTVEVERARYALDLALAGERVAVVSGGDAGVFGMASAVFEAAEDDRYAEVKITVLPGVTAAQAVAARAGAPLGGDYAVLSLSDRLKPWPVIEKRLRAIADADLVLALYNPASGTRREQIVRARELLLELRPADTPVVVGRRICRQDEDLSVTTLEALQPTSIDMSCLLIIGSSQTRRSHGSMVWTSRSYQVPGNEGPEVANDAACRTDETPQIPQHAVPHLP